MIALLTGLVAAQEADRCVIDVGGVGYLVQASARSLAALPHPPERARLLIETHVRDDAILLYGFADAAERDWFRLLTTIQGVGGKVALSILSALAPDALIGAIATGDKAALTRAPGVGARLALRLLTELRDKAGAMPGGGGGAVIFAPAGAGPASVAADALSALLHLGYRRAEAEAAMARLGEGVAQASLDNLIRDALKELSR